MALTFEWDARKARSNLRKHGVSFVEAATVFADPLTVTIYDPDHSSAREERFITLGHSVRRRAVVVVHCDRGDSIRIVSARLATRGERKQYEERR